MGQSHRGVKEQNFMATRNHKRHKSRLAQRRGGRRAFSNQPTVQIPPIPNIPASFICTRNSAFQWGC